jgi:eukaryotic-like serine/threonine-protein kinase
MDAEWLRRDRLLAEALEQPAPARAAFLDRACSGDAALRETLEQLLAAAEEPDGFLDAPAVELAAGLVADWAEGQGDGAAPDLAPEGRRVGPYRLLEKLGEGGMGTVWLAERADGQFEQRVALKLVRTGMASEEVRRRFRRERQILASLNHPHIARLLDGGVFAGPDGEEQPYLVMELVAGEPLTAYCERRRLPVEARLALFAEVCEAVRYAHGHLVVHRDLKPSNVLVAEDEEGRPSVKLLDFGIARLLEEEDAGTRTLLPRLTPEYAAPEQVRGEAATTATDVYSLGVVLYELLTGRRPYGFARLTAAEVERVVCEWEPERPSAAVAQASRFADAERTAEPGALRLRLRGDLDAVVLKALRKEPAARYATVDALLEDVRHHLAGRPVAAHAPTAAYRARLFVRRHRWGVAAAAAFALLLMGFSAVTAVQSRQIRVERDRARSEAGKATRVTDFLLSLFEANDPNVARGDTLTAGELMARGLREAEALRSQPEVQAEMLEVIGRTYDRMGRLDLAAAPLEEALALRRRLHPESHPDLARSLFLRAATASDLGDYGRAEPLFREALALQRDVLRPGDPALGATLYGLAGLLHFQGRQAESDTLFRQAVHIFRRLPAAPEDPETVGYIKDVAGYLHYSRSYADAEALYRQAVRMQEAYYGEAHPALAETRFLLADVLFRTHRYPESERLYRRGLDVALPSLDERHFVVRQGLRGLAQTAYHQGRYAEAERLLRRVLDANPGHEWTGAAGPLLDLGQVVAEQGRLAEAEPLLQESLRLRREELGDGSAFVAEGLVALGRLARLQGDHDAALAHLTRARSLYTASLREDHPWQATVLRELGHVRVGAGAFAEAEPLLRRSLAIQRRNPPMQPYAEAETQRLLGVALTHLGRFDEAEGALRAAARTAEHTSRPEVADQLRRALHDLEAARDAALR